MLDGNIDLPGYFADLPLQGTSLRMDNDLATARTLDAFFERCAAAGPDRCALADTGADAAAMAAKFDTLAQHLAARPVTLAAFPGVTLTEPATLNLVSAWLFVVQPFGDFPGWTALADVLEQLWKASLAVPGAASPNQHGRLGGADRSHRGCRRAGLRQRRRRLGRPVR